ncbi:peptidase S53 [Tersicoccus phoenicis]|uniref:Peptidase S53 n=1 Tax=Tersicoccus phoenicis TaxID=554083 RepID=A0A1R1LGK2_9MICC|nr:S53 family peptidase [Tersicoccus phoenicis]OMH26667.1 peptidase S53 [Tersicoccus phoenicis]
MPNPDDSRSTPVTPPRHVPLPGSERAAAPGVTAGQPVDPAQRAEVTVVLRRRAPLPEAELTAGRVLTREELGARHGAVPADVELATRVLTDAGLTVVESDAPSRRLRVAGTVGTLSTVFGTALDAVSSTAPDGRAVQHRHRTGGLTIPAELDGIVIAVLGLDDRPQASAHFQAVAPAAATGTAYTPVDLGRIYRFPAAGDGTGTDVAILELGGGYQQADLDTYFRGLGLPTPTVQAVSVDGATNAPTMSPNGPDGEVALDIEVVGGLAPGARILVYFAPNTDAGFLDALTNAAQAAPAAISISWGQNEDAWTAQARTAFDAALADATALGVTVTAAAGDNGSADGATDGRDHADFPASSPNALACGGTRLEADPRSGTITAETVWNEGPNSATGGGFSDAFPLPDWQRSAVSGQPAAAGRGVPDVSAVADPQTGYRVRVDGQDMVIGGTSAVAPLWAALVARLRQLGGAPLGLLQPRLYQAAVAATFHDITSGNNGSFSAGPGWDPCTGLGSPDGEALAGALASTPS